MFKKSSGNSLTRIRKRRPLGSRGGRVASRRNLKLVIESEDDREGISNSEMLSGQIWDRLGSKGRFVAISILIKLTIHTINQIAIFFSNNLSFKFHCRC